MLFFAAAILFSTAHLFGGTGAAVAPSHAAATTDHTHIALVAASADDTPSVVPPADAGADAPVTRVTDGITLTAPQEGAPASSSTLAACGAVDGRATAASTPAAGTVGIGASTGLQAAACLEQLAAASPAQLDRFGSSLPDDTARDVAFATALSERGTAAAVASWWTTLPSARQTALVRAMPGVVGNLEGVPYTVRDRANRRTLGEVVARLQAEQTRTHLGLLSFGGPTRRLTMLQQVGLALQRGREGDDSPRQLVSLDTVFPGRAAVSVGNLDTADDVTLMVPGMLYTVSNQITFWTDRAADLHSEQQFYSNALATVTSAPRTSATVAWMGYRTPDLTNFLNLGLARKGAVHLEDTVHGLDAARRADAPRLNIIAHSYGSTTATIALSNGSIHADSFTVLGSPGSVVAHATQLAVARGGVYAAAAALDPVAGSGFFGADPGATAFGATLLDVAGGTDPFTEQHLSATLTHNGYFWPGSESVRNLALIGIGRGDLTGGRGPDPHAPTELQSPSIAFVRPQDVYRESLSV